jgi:hypothetical protein
MSLASAANISPRPAKGTNAMFLRLELAQRTAFSVVAALAFAAVAISAAVPVTPIA